MKDECNLAPRWRFWVRSAVSALAIVILTSLAALGDDGKLARELKGRKGSQTVDVMVQYRSCRGVS